MLVAAQLHKVLRNDRNFEYRNLRQARAAVSENAEVDVGNSSRPDAGPLPVVAASCPAEMMMLCVPRPREEVREIIGGADRVILREVLQHVDKPLEISRAIADKLT